MNATRALRLLLLTLGAACAAIGLMHMLFGPAIVPGATAVNATLDSEDRFFGALFLAYGCACLWCGAAVLERLTAANVLAATFFLGGLVRLGSIAAVGWPHPFFVAMAALELAIPPVIVWLTVGVRRALAHRVSTFLLLENVRSPGTSLPAERG